MKISKLKIERFRGIRECTLSFTDHAVLIGDNNSGKSTVLEAIDLALGLALAPKNIVPCPSLC